MPSRRPSVLRDALDFYRSHPVVLVIAVAVAGAVIAGVVSDGSVALGEIIAVVVAGLLVGLVWAAIRGRGQGSTGKTS